MKEADGIECPLHKQRTFIEQGGGLIWYRCPAYGHIIGAGGVTKEQLIKKGVKP